MVSLTYPNCNNKNLIKIGTRSACPLDQDRNEDKSLLQNPTARAEDDQCAHQDDEESKKAEQRPPPTTAQSKHGCCVSGAPPAWQQHDRTPGGSSIPSRPPRRRLPSAISLASSGPPKVPSRHPFTDLSYSLPAADYFRVVL
jgi:hypothetical protein